MKHALMGIGILCLLATNANAQIWEHSSSLFTAMPEVGEPPVGHPLR